MSAVPGWYPDPAGSTDLRFWDGEAWSAQTGPPAAAAVPPARQDADFPRAMVTAGGGAPPEGASYFYGHGFPSASPLERAALPGQLKEAPKKRRLLIGGAGVAIVAAAVSITLVLQNSGSIYERTHVAMPDSVEGFKQVAHVDAKAGKSLANSLPVTGISMGVYAQGDSRTPAAMLMVGRVKMTPARINAEMSKAQSNFSTDFDGEQAVKISPFQEIAPGSLGGRMGCATLEVDAIPAAACVFMDQGAVGMIVTYQTTSVDTALMQRLRAGIEKRS
ncbi:MAG: hypothetical protein JWN96_488 [Mycobacterium sp.]|nr:hypothetical protein [Mycobacterium sp.]